MTSEDRKVQIDRSQWEHYLSELSRFRDEEDKATQLIRQADGSTVYVKDIRRLVEISQRREQLESEHRRWLLSHL